MMSEDETIESIQMETAQILLRYLKAIKNTDMALPEAQVRAVPEVTLAINTILRDLRDLERQN